MNDKYEVAGTFIKDKISGDIVAVLATTPVACAPNYRVKEAKELVELANSAAAIREQHGRMIFYLESIKSHVAAGKRGLPNSHPDGVSWLLDQINRCVDSAFVTNDENDFTGWVLDRKDPDAI